MEASNNLKDHHSLQFRNNQLRNIIKKFNLLKVNKQEDIVFRFQISYLIACFKRCFVTRMNGGGR